MRLSRPLDVETNKTKKGLAKSRAQHDGSSRSAELQIDKIDSSSSVDKRGGNEQDPLIETRQPERVAK